MLDLRAPRQDTTAVGDQTEPPTAASSEDRAANYWHAQGHELALPRCHGSRLPPNTHDPNTVCDRCSLPLLRGQTNAGNGDDAQNSGVFTALPSLRFCSYPLCSFSSPLLAPYLLLLAFLPSSHWRWKYQVRLKPRVGCQEVVGVCGGLARFFPHQLPRFGFSCGARPPAALSGDPSRA